MIFEQERVKVISIVLSNISWICWCVIFLQCIYIMVHALDLLLINIMVLAALYTRLGEENILVLTGQLKFNLAACFLVLLVVLWCSAVFWVRRIKSGVIYNGLVCHSRSQQLTQLRPGVRVNRHRRNTPIDIRDDANWTHKVWADHAIDLRSHLELWYLIRGNTSEIGKWLIKSCPSL